MTDSFNDKISRRQTLVGLIAAGMVPVIASPATAAGKDFATFNKVFGEKIVLPVFDRLAEATSHFTKVVDEFIAAPDGTSIELLKTGFHNLADAWALAQQFRVGPLAQEQRAERFAYWPERRNVVEKQLNLLLAGKGEEGLQADQFANISVAVQGLPALERILYADDQGRLLLEGDQSGRRRAIVLAIAQNLQTIAADIQKTWLENLKDPIKAANSFATNPNEGVAQSYTNLLTILQIVADQKIGTPLGGADVADAKPKAAEQWRSGRSLTNIRLNLETAKASVTASGGFVELLQPDQIDLRNAITKAFDDALAAVKPLTQNLSTVVSDHERRKSLTALLVKVNHLRDLLRQQMPPAIGVTLGFNELDGDGS